MERAEMRAGDGDREAVATRLRAALDDGRLDLHEFDERLQRVYSAKTYGELDPLTHDLPGTIPAAQSQVQPVAPAAQPPPEAERQGPNWIWSYGGVIVVSVIIWAISSAASGHALFFWPVWMLIPLILGIAGQMSGRQSKRDRRRRP